MWERRDCNFGADVIFYLFVRHSFMKAPPRMRGLQVCPKCGCSKIVRNKRDLQCHFSREHKKVARARAHVSKNTLAPPPLGKRLT